MEVFYQMTPCPPSKAPSSKNDPPTKWPAYVDLLRAGLRVAQSAECLTAEREVGGSIPGAGPTLRVLK